MATPKVGTAVVGSVTLGEGIVSSVELPSGDVYEFEDLISELDSSYESETGTVTLIFG